MSSFNFGVDAENRRHSDNTNHESSNAAYYDGDRLPPLPTACNRYICIDTRRVQFIATVTWWPWRIFKVLAVTWENSETTMIWIHQIGEDTNSLCL